MLISTVFVYIRVCAWVSNESNVCAIQGNSVSWWYEYNLTLTLFFFPACPDRIYAMRLSDQRHHSASSYQRHPSFCLPPIPPLAFPFPTPTKWAACHSSPSFWPNLPPFLSPFHISFSAIRPPPSPFFFPFLSIFPSSLPSPFFISPLCVHKNYSVHALITKWQSRDSFHLLKARVRCVQIYLSPPLLSQAPLPFFLFFFTTQTKCVPWATLGSTVWKYE